MFYFCIDNTIGILALSYLCVPVSNTVVESSPSPGFRSRGIETTRRGTDVCSNQGGGKHETGGTYFKCGAGHHWPPAGNRPVQNEFSVMLLLFSRCGNVVILNVVRATFNTVSFLPVF